MKTMYHAAVNPYIFAPDPIGKIFTAGEGEGARKASYGQFPSEHLS